MRLDDDQFDWLMDHVEHEEAQTLSEALRWAINRARILEYLLDHRPEVREALQDETRGRSAKPAGSLDR